MYYTLLSFHFLNLQCVFMQNVFGCFFMFVRFWLKKYWYFGVSLGIFWYLFWLCFAFFSLNFAFFIVFLQIRVSFGIFCNIFSFFSFIFCTVIYDKIKHIDIIFINTNHQGNGDSWMLQPFGPFFEQKKNLPLQFVTFIQNFFHNFYNLFKLW